MRETSVAHHSRASATNLPTRHDAGGDGGRRETSQLRWRRHEPWTLAAAGANVADLLTAPTRSHLLMVTGPLPGGGGVDRFRDWATPAPGSGWEPFGDQYVHPEQPRLSYRADDGRVAMVYRAAPWFGEDVTPGTAAAAYDRLRGQLTKLRWPLLPTPASTGRLGLWNTWAHTGIAPPSPLPAAMQDQIRAHSGQGRFQLFAAAARGGKGLWKYDGRLMYGDLAAHAEMPAGEPIMLGRVAPSALSAWRHNAGRFLVNARAPRGWSAPSLIGVPQEAGGVAWDRLEGTVWLDNAELQLLVDRGWSVEVLRGVVWPERARYLAPWARILVAGARDPFAPIAHAYRAMLVQGIGALHGRPHRVLRAGEDVPGRGAEDVSYDDAAGLWRWTELRPTAMPELAHPEWTAHLWARARVRLYGGTGARPVGLERVAPRDLVACALDAIYTNRPQPFTDDGRPGTFRPAGQWGAWDCFGTMRELYAFTSEGHR